MLFRSSVVTTALTKSIEINIFFLLNLSVKTPAGKVKISQGNWLANESTAINNGFRVKLEPIQGPATAVTPLPKPEIAFALQRRQKFELSPDFI